MDGMQGAIGKQLIEPANYRPSLTLIGGNDA